MAKQQPSYLTREIDRRKHNQHEVDFTGVPYWSDSMCISYLQRRVIVHSIIYYVLGTNVISDQKFDGISHQLVDFMWDADERELKRSEYYYCMYDFDGSTGFDLPSRLNSHDSEYLRTIAEHVIRCYKEEKKKQRSKKNGR